MDLTKVPDFANQEAIHLSLKKMSDHGLVFVDLGSSCSLHHPKGEVRTKNLDEGKRFIDLARETVLSLCTGISESVAEGPGPGGVFGFN